MTNELIIQRRFRGPLESGNGGYVCGLVANRIGGPAEVTLRTPPPLDTPLLVNRDGDQVSIMQGEMIVASGKPSTVELEVPTPPGFDEAQEAEKNFIGFTKHYLPECFVCGLERGEADGLRIFAGPPVSNREIVAAPWIPDTSLASHTDEIRPEFAWAALDCPGFFAAGRQRPDFVALLGRQAASIGRLPKVDERCVVIGWRLGSEGRKHYSGTALFGLDGALLAYARATWIEFKS